MKTRYARLIRSAILAAREDTAKVDNAHFWAKYYETPVYRNDFILTMHITTQRSDNRLWFKAYCKTAEKCGYTVFGGQLLTYQRTE